MAELKYKEGYGYSEDGEPTDLQISIQDEVDSAITETMLSIARLSMDVLEEGTSSSIDPSHDINKITQIRELIQNLYGIPDFY